MRGGGTADTIAKWKPVAATEPDGRLRSTYRGLTEVFARLMRAANGWAQSLEGWNVPKSPVIEGWRTEGRVEMARGKLLEPIELRFRAAIPSDLREVVQESNDLNELDDWFRLVFFNRSLSAYRRAIGH